MASQPHRVSSLPIPLCQTVRRALLSAVRSVPHIIRVHCSLVVCSLSITQVLAPTSLTMPIRWDQCTGVSWSVERRLPVVVICSCQQRLVRSPYVSVSWCTTLTRLPYPSLTSLPRLIRCISCPVVTSQRLVFIVIYASGQSVICVHSRRRRVLSTSIGYHLTLLERFCRERRYLRICDRQVVTMFHLITIMNTLSMLPV